LKNKIFKEYKIKVSGNSNLYLYFIILSSKWLEKYGISAWLIPSEFLKSNYGAALRGFLTSKVTLLRVHNFNPEELQFEGVLVASSVIIFKNSAPKDQNSILYTMNGSITKPKNIKNISCKKLRLLNKWPSNINDFKGVSNNHLSLKNIFKITRGIATGANSFFILPLNKAINIGIPNEFLKPILPKPNQLKKRIIINNNYGFPDVDPQLCVIDCSLPEDEIKNKFPKMWEYLKIGIDKGITNRTLIKNRKPWYKQEKRTPPPFFCPYFGRINNNGNSFKFIWNTSNAIATNSYLLMYPIGLLKESLEKGKINEESIFNILNEKIVPKIEKECRKYGGGLNKLEPKDLGLVNANEFNNIINL